MTAVSTGMPGVDKGLEHTIASESEMSFIDGGKGILEYVGIPIGELAQNSSYEEVVYLLWNKKLPTSAELESFIKEIRDASDLPEQMWDFIKQIPVDAPPMSALRTMVSALSLYDADAESESLESNRNKSIRILASMPTLIANFDRHRKHREFIRPDKNLSIAASFIKMLTGKEPTDSMANALDTCLVLHVDHGLNASTFAAIVTISTLSDMYSAVTTAIGTLKGPLHGGANEAVMRMLQEIGELDKVPAFIEGKLERKEKIMGFGHRVYKVWDPRAIYLRGFAEHLAADTGNEKLFAMSDAIEKIMEQRVGDRGIHPNVDFFSATTYRSLGLEIDLFTPMFAMSRVAGWAGHCMEQLADNRIMRPRCAYTGPHDAPYTPIENRG
ncbi:MAG: citrate/2-methylcitrate synthase [Phycisphaerales bacterium]|nr:citrate/2-methylcitrate synthase [Phycisphaerales bacterium]